MQYNFLGKTGLKVSKLCLGTMNFGPMTDEKDAFEIMDAALDLGINFFDTADMYGQNMSTDPTIPDRNGWTEEIIGRWLAQGGRREKIILATKLYLPMQDKDFGPNDGNGLSATKISRRLEGSLKRLQTDHIDLYQMHRAERRTSWNEMWAAFEKAYAQDKITYVGSSNFEAYDLCKAQWAADKRNNIGIVTEQHRYNLFARSAERELIPACEDLGIGLIVWSPLAAGLLGGNALKKREGKTRSARQVLSITEKQKEQLQAFEKLCNELGEKQSHVALAWVLHQPAVSSVLLGARTVEQLQDSVKAAELVLDEKTLKAIDEIFPPCPAPAPGEIIKLD